MELLKKIAGLLLFGLPSTLYTTAATFPIDKLQQSTYELLLNKKLNSISCGPEIAGDQKTSKQSEPTNPREQTGCHSAGALMCDNRKALRCMIGIGS